VITHTVFLGFDDAFGELIQLRFPDLAQRLFVVVVRVACR
jgi:hypothetical protein